MKDAFPTARVPKASPPLMQNNTGLRGVDKSGLPEARRHRDIEHLRFVGQQPCPVCGRRQAGPTALHATLRSGRQGQRRIHHALVRHPPSGVAYRGDERVWRAERNFFPLPAAAGLWWSSQSRDPASEGARPSETEKWGPRA